MTYECDNDNHNIGCQCPGVVPRRWRIHNSMTYPNIYYVFTTENDARTALLALHAAGQRWEIEELKVPGRPPPPPIDWETKAPEPMSLWRAAWNVVRFVATGKGQA